MVDQLEKLSRSVLWLVLAAICVFVPLGLARQHDQETRAQADAAKAEIDSHARQEAPKRLTLGSVGGFFSTFDRDQARAAVIFSNVSARAGVLCVVGVVTDASGKTSKSLGACKAVEAYDSNVAITMEFASDLLDVCPSEDKCQLTINDAPDRS